MGTDGSIPPSMSGRIRIRKHAPSSLTRRAAMSWARVSRRELAPTAHIDHHVLPFTSLLRRHVMSSTRPTPWPSAWRNLQAYRHREGCVGDRNVWLHTMRSMQTWRGRGSASDGAHSTWTWWHLPRRVTPYWAFNMNMVVICMCSVHCIHHGHGGSN